MCPCRFAKHLEAKGTILMIDKEFAQSLWKFFYCSRGSSDKLINGRADYCAALRYIPRDLLFAARVDLHVVR